MRPGDGLYKSEDEKVELVARNSLLLFDEVARLIRTMGDRFNLSPELIQGLHAITVKDVYSCAGRYRDHRVRISGSPHRPPGPDEVPGLVMQLCEDFNADGAADPIESAAYLLWKLNWIHPFGGGNGRSSRAACYLALCARASISVSVFALLPEQIKRDRELYVGALRDADEAWRMGVRDTSRMAELLNGWLEEQLEQLIGPM